MTRKRQNPFVHQTRAEIIENLLKDVEFSQTGWRKFCFSNYFKNFSAFLRLELSPHFILTDPPPPSWSFWPKWRGGQLAHVRNFCQNFPQIRIFCVVSKMSEISVDFLENYRYFYRIFDKSEIFVKFCDIFKNFSWYWL